MKTIRTGVFETNSSSTHSLCLCTKEEYIKWRDESNPSLVFDKDVGRLIPLSDAKEKIIRMKQRSNRQEEINRINSMSEEELYKFVTDYCFYSYETYQDREDNEANETYYDEFTTPKGDTVVLFGYEGYDG